MKKVTVTLAVALLLLLAGCSSSPGRLSPEEADRTYDWSQDELIEYVIQEYGADAILAKLAYEYEYSIEPMLLYAVDGSDFDEIFDALDDTYGRRYVERYAYGRYR